MSSPIPDLHLQNGITIPAETIAGFFWGGVESGIRWLGDVPALVASICQEHKISDLRPSPEMRMNLVLFGESAIHGPIVLKLAQPHAEVRSEIAALTIFSGTGRYAPIIIADAEAGWSLQQRIIPGDMLQTYAQTGDVSDEEATRITAHLMNDTVKPVPDKLKHEFRDLNGWLKSLWEYAESGKSVIPSDQVQLAVRHARELVAHPEQPMLLHGDFHHGNILKSETGWVMIDAKGLIAEKAFEVGPFFYNPIGIDKHPDLVSVFDSRLDIFSEILGIDRLSLWKNALVACVLSDCWSLEDGPVDHCHFNTVTAALMQLPERYA